MARKNRTVRLRIEEALREMGLLFMTFAPLDGAINADRPTVGFWALTFLALGVIVFMIGVTIERRRLNAG
jgi:hypothetical protein